MSVPLVIVVTLLTFVLNSLAPGDMAMTILGADGTREQYEALRTELGLDRPLLLQYLSWLSQAVQGDLGVSHFTKESVTSLLNPRLGVSVSIMVGVLVVCLSVGLALGVASALQGGWVGRAIPFQNRQLTLADTALPDAEQGSHAQLRHLRLTQDFHLQPETLKGFCPTGEFLGVEHVGRFGDQVSGKADSVG
jgi:hypothetical protein